MRIYKLVVDSEGKRNGCKSELKKNPYDPKIDDKFCFMPQYNTGLRYSSLPIGAKELVAIGGKQIALFRLAESVHALDELCPHRDAPMHTGTLDGDAVVCPWHQWRFKLKDGTCTNIPGVKTRAYPVHLLEDNIWVELPD